MTKKILLTGSHGFVGSSLRTLLGSKYQFVIVEREDTNRLEILRRKLAESDLLIHLAGISSVGECQTNPQEAYTTNVSLSCFLAELFYSIQPKGHFLFASTGLVYSREASLPYKETSEVYPETVYARTKLCAEAALETLATTLGGQLTILRLFNHSHKSQQGPFFLPNVLAQIQGSSNSVELSLGNIDIQRDFSSIQDLANAIDQIIGIDSVHRNPCEIFNVCSGSSKNLKDLASLIAQSFGKELKVAIDPSKQRVGEVLVQYGDPSKLETYTSWRSQSKTLDGFVHQFLRDI